MELVRDWSAYQSCLSGIDRDAADYTSNLYASHDQIERWCEAGCLWGLVAGKALLLLRADRDFYHIYHAAESRGALQEALAKLPSGTYTSDLIGQGDILDEASSPYAANGFTPHAVLMRLSRVQTPDQASENCEIVAAEEDADEVAALLDRLLDRYSEQVPDAHQLRAAAAAGRLLAVRRQGAIAGMLLYELKGQMAHLRFWHVDPDVHGQGFGRELMKGFLSRCAGARRLVLWVMADNQRSIAIYQHYGFKADGLLDRIMIRRKEQPL